MTAAPHALVTERRTAGELPLWSHPAWQERFPWLAQGVTSGAEQSPPFDLGLSGEQPAGEVLGRWRALLSHFGMGAVLSRQVHGSQVRPHQTPLDGGLLLLDGYDGHVTATAGVLLAVSVADCVPVWAVDPDARAVAAVHAGWRGVAGGILERALGALAQAHGSRPGSLWVHCGPAICGRCYEVGPEVHRGVFPGRTPPAGPTPIDLREALAGRAVAAGVPEERVSLSTHCTRCGGAGFFSHRGGWAARQVALLGVRGDG